MKTDKYILVLDKDTVSACMLALLVAEICAHEQHETHYADRYRKAYTMVATEKNRNVDLQAV